MGNPGITTQYGFEFQKLVFMYYALQLSVGNTIIYEGADDVELSGTDVLNRFRLGNCYIQAKSGNVTQSTAEKIFCNWLLAFNNDNEYKCVIERPLVCDYRNNSFRDDLIKKICEAKGRSDSLFVKVKKLYYINDVKELSEKLDFLINKAEFIQYSFDELYLTVKNNFAAEYCADTSVSFLHDERFGAIYDTICLAIRDAMINKISYVLPHKDLFKLISDVQSRMNNNRYDVSFSKFKAKSTSKLKEILKSESDAVKQLKVVFNNDVEQIMDNLTEKIFYEDLRNFFLQMSREDDIYDLEYLAHSNYKDVIIQLKLNGDDLVPQKIYRMTIDSDLESVLLSTSSANNKFYKRGCYIHLTDTDVDDELKIKWEADNA